MVVFDIDGVVADARHRLHLVRSTPKQYDEFYARVKDDPVLEAGVALYQSLSIQNEIMYLTGRRRSTETDTTAWLRRHGLIVPAYLNHVIFRPDHDYRPAMVFKLEQLRKIERDIAKVTLVVDDDPRTCLALSAAGYSVLQPWWAHEHDDLSVEAIAKPALYA